MEIRTIITESLSRANIVPRRQPAPGDLVQSAYNLLQGVINQFNNDNYLAFTQRQISLPCKKLIHIYDEDDTLAGENNLYFNTPEDLSGYTITEEDYHNNVWAMVNDGQHDNVLYTIISISTPGGVQYQWVGHPNPDEFNTRYQGMKRYIESYHIHVKGVAKLNTLMIAIPTAGAEAVKLAFVPRSDFDRYYRNELAWTFSQFAEGEWLIETKSYALAGSNKLRLDYNEAVRFDLDTDLRVPDAYLELLTVALTYKLAVKYPRMDDTKVANLAAELQTMIDNVSAPKADVKLVKRDSYDVNDYTYWGVVSGRFLY